jgi:hypothetical protein
MKKHDEKRKVVFSRVFSYFPQYFPHMLKSKIKSEKEKWKSDVKCEKLITFVFNYEHLY